LKGALDEGVGGGNYLDGMGNEGGWESESMRDDKLRERLWQVSEMFYSFQWWQ